MTIGRRGFLTGLASLVAAPAIVKASNLMPVRGIVMDVRPVHTFVFRTGLPVGAWRALNEGVSFSRPGIVTFDAYCRQSAEQMFSEWQNGERWGTRY